MKKLLCVFAAAALFASCDMALVQKTAPRQSGGALVAEGGGGGGGNGDAEAIAELERNGHYLMLYHLPAGARAEHVSSLRVTDGAAQVARPSSPALAAADGPAYTNVYIPLLAVSGAPFARTGSFYVEFTVAVDAVTRIAVRAEHRALAAFEDGRAAFDVESFIKGSPDAVESAGDPDTENQIDAIVNAGGYIHFINLPRQVSPAKFSSVAASTASGVAARCPDYDAVAVRRGAVTSEAFVPLVATRGAPFLEDGSYFVTFTVTVDATARIAVASNYFLSDFEAGVTLVDAALIPDAPIEPVLAPNALTVYGLPATASPSNFADVYILNAQGPVAACPDYARISVIPMGDGKAAVIPLVFDGNRAFNGLPFSDSGSFIVAFSFHPDALQSFVVTPENNCIVEFSNGGASLDLNGVPAAPHRYLTITNLPANTQELNIAGVFVWNQAGKVAQCEDYSLLEFIRDGEQTALKIPLVYSAAADRIFEETGPYFVSFDLNVDALTRILIAEQDRVLASFSGGSASLDARLLPQALPVPYLTIVGLPFNTAKNNFSDIFLWNAVGKTAKCRNVADIVISKSAGGATAMIPLVYNDSPAEYFRDSGEFVVSFTINVDVNTQIVKTREDALSTIFADGSGFLDMGADRGYFSGGLVNPDDTSPPVIKQGTVFEIDGSYIQVKNNASVTPSAFDKTCVAYVYAVQRTGRIEFVYSADAPSFVPEKNAWYFWNARALFKFVFVKDAVDRYVAKIPVDASWRPFERHTLAAPSAAGAEPAVRNLPSAYSLDGASNPQPASRTFAAGWHLFVLAGAGGGGGGGIDGLNDRDYHGGRGGDGGFVAELVYLPQTSMTLFTGSGGSGSGAVSYGCLQGTGAGGGGAGTFAYAPAGWLLCAGGGGGGSGHQGGGSGGAGGGTGPGGGGGYGQYGGNGLAPSSGGAGGGYGGGSGGLPFWLYPDQPIPHWGYDDDGNVLPGYEPENEIHEAAPAGGGASLSPGNSMGFGSEKPPGPLGAFYSAGGAASFAQYGEPDDWKNTSGANGRGANSVSFTGGAGGNSRNPSRGGGGAGGAGGQPSDSPLSAGKKGGAGSIAVYAVQ